MQWITEAARVLTKTGTLYICDFSEILADLKHPAMKHFAASWFGTTKTKPT
jgi:site-specific DNA-methyltransferase (adenine-specific)